MVSQISSINSIIVGQDLLEDTEHGSKILGLHQDLQADSAGGGVFAGKKEGMLVDVCRCIYTCNRLINGHKIINPHIYIYICIATDIHLEQQNFFQNDMLYNFGPHLEHRRCSKCLGVF